MIFIKLAKQQERDILMMDDASEKVYHRLSDRVLEALKLALEQKDIAIAELMTRALEMSMSRNAGGRGFVERREFSQEMEAVLDKLNQLKRESKGL